MGLKDAAICGIICCLVVAGMILRDPSASTQRTLRTADATTSGSSMPSYNHIDVKEAFNTIGRDNLFYLLVFDGHHFLTYTMGRRRLTYRPMHVVPLLVHALLTRFPARFAPGSAVFQMVFLVGDVPVTICASHHCPKAAHFPPIANFGSHHRNETFLPTLKAMPTPPYMHCLYAYKMGQEPCDEFHPKLANELKWDELTPTIVWRGSDWQSFLKKYDSTAGINSKWMNKRFTDEVMDATTSKERVVEMLYENYTSLTPRWKAAMYTLQAKIDPDGQDPWIDVMFTEQPEKALHDRFARVGLPVASAEYMSAYNMSKYRYQIDLGGGGGTTWEGTLQKLQMNGVLFHHATPVKDFYFDLMEPYKHFVPVSHDLGDVWAAHEWVKEHRDEAQQISKEATKLAEYILSNEYMDRVFEEHFVDYLGKVIEAYAPVEGASWFDVMHKEYISQGIPLHLISDCSPECRIEFAKLKTAHMTTTVAAAQR